MDLGLYAMTSLFSGLAPMFVDIIAYSVIDGAIIGALMGMGKK